MRSSTVQRTYLILILLNTLAASFIWGVNTLFLLDAGLSNLQAFTANAFFTVGQVLFEIPTGVIADRWGRRVSYILGTFTLMVTTLMYLALWEKGAPFWAWAVVSALLGLGFTFFSGATEAWLVDALHATGHKGPLEPVFARGQIVTGIAMLVGSVAGGWAAQVTNLGVPYILRTVVLGLNMIAAIFLMKDLGFTPKKGKSVRGDIKIIFRHSLEHGLRNPPVRWIMLAAPFSMGVSIYGFYAAQPYLLKLYGNPTAYGIAGLAAAIVAGAQILGGLLAPRIRHIFKFRTSALIAGVALSALLLVGIGSVSHFWLAIVLLMLWGLLFAAQLPIRQAYLNGLIPSAQRATVLSFDSLFASTGGVVFQPMLGKAADVWSYGSSYVLAGFIQAMALPFVVLAQREKAKSDLVKEETADVTDRTGIDPASGPPAGPHPSAD